MTAIQVTSLPIEAVVITCVHFDEIQRKGVAYIVPMRKYEPEQPVFVMLCLECARVARKGFRETGRFHIEAPEGIAL